MTIKKLSAMLLALVMMFGCVVATVSAETDNSANLDAKTNTSKVLNQNYTFQKAYSSYTDATKVKIEWAISDISASYRSDRTWNPDTMSWEEKSKSDVAVTSSASSFTFTNYSSKNIVATVSFDADSAVSDTFDKVTYANNGCTVKTPVVEDDTATYDEDDFTALKETVTATLSFNNDAFASHSDVSSSTKYGAYTVTIEMGTTVPTAKTGLTYTGKAIALMNSGSTGNGEWQYKLGADGTYSTSIPTATNIGTYTVYYKVVGGNNNPYAQEASTEVTIAKAVQTAPSVPSVATQTLTSVTLNAVTETGYGDTLYAVSTENTAPESGWQTGTEFTNLASSTVYYFFAKFAGTDIYDSAVSAGKEISTGYNVTFPSIINSTTESDSNKNLTVKLVDESEYNVIFTDKANGTVGISLQISGNNYVSSTHTYTNVKTLSRVNSYITYYIGSDQSKSYTWDFGNGDFVPTSDITITKVGISQCIDENSMVTMADGSLKALKDIEVGDEVLSIDFDTMTLVSRKVIYTSKDEANYDNWTVASYYLHTFSDGTVIKRAMRHRFYCLEEQCYKHMDYWTEGLHAYKIDGTNPYLVSTEIVQEELHYARITLEGSNNYFANGLATGDSECCPNKVVLNELLGK